MAHTEKTTVALREEIAELDTAISTLIKGNRLRSLTVGSGEFQRRYSYAEITLESLQAERDHLLKLLQDKTPDTAPKFRRVSHQLAYSKGLN